jgi:chromate transporter
VGLISFGGPAAQIAILQEEFVERRGWIDQPSFLRALNFCMLLPGPEAQQLATYLGYRLHGLKGALTAGWAFVIPGAAVMFALAWLAAAQGQWPPLQAVFRGLLPVVVALVLHAVWRIGSRTLKTPAAWSLAIAAFVAVVARLPFPLVLLSALAAGVIVDRFGLAAGQAGHSPPGTATTADPPARWRTLALHLLRTSAAIVLVGTAPVAATIAAFGTEPFADVAAFFTKAAFVTFGGAYAVLPYIAQAGVEQYGWLDTPTMMQGLALAETTPGPLILVTEFIGFFAGWNGAAQAGLPPLTAAAIAAGLTVWCTFLPSFWFIIAGAPLVERLTSDRRALAALAGVTSAVVGVIASLAVTLGRATFLPDGRVDVVAILLTIAAFLALWRLKASPLILVALGGAAGVLRWLTGI